MIKSTRLSREQTFRDTRPKINFWLFRVEEMPGINIIMMFSNKLSTLKAMEFLTVMIVKEGTWKTLFAQTTESKMRNPAKSLNITLFRHLTSYVGPKLMVRGLLY